MQNCWSSPLLLFFSALFHPNWWRCCMGRYGGNSTPPVLDSKHRAARCFFAVKKEMVKKVIYQRMRHKKLDLFHRAPFSPWIKKKKRPLTSGASVWHNYLFFFFFFFCPISCLAWNFPDWIWNTRTRPKGNRAFFFFFHSFSFLSLTFLDRIRNTVP